MGCVAHIRETCAASETGNPLEPRQARARLRSTSSTTNRACTASTTDDVQERKTKVTPLDRPARSNARGRPAASRAAGSCWTVSRTACRRPRCASTMAEQLTNRTTPQRVGPRREARTEAECGCRWLRLRVGRGAHQDMTMSVDAALPQDARHLSRVPAAAHACGMECATGNRLAIASVPSQGDDSCHATRARGLQAIA